MRSLTALVVLLSTATAIAQPAERPTQAVAVVPPNNALELDEIRRLERSGESRINGGVALAILGGAGLIGGGLLLHRGVTAESEESDNPFETLGDDLGAGFDTAFGAMIISAAIPVTIASIYLIGSGKSRHNEADRRRDALRFAPSVGEHGVGAVVSGRF